MKLFSRIFRAKRDMNMTTMMERKRFSSMMPGQTAALAGNRLGVLV